MISDTAARVMCFRQRDRLRLPTAPGTRGQGPCQALSQEGAAGAGPEREEEEAPACAEAVHCQFAQTRAATGRLATDHPNLQGLPKPFEFVGALTYTVDSVHAELQDSLLPPFLPPRTEVLFERVRHPGKYRTGSLVAVLDERLHQPFAHACAAGDSPSGSESDDDEPERSVGEATQRGGGGAAGGGSSGGSSGDPAAAENSVVAFWRRHGHVYSSELSWAVQQVVVRLPSQGGGGGAVERVVPADRVWRLHSAVYAPQWRQLRPPDGAHVVHAAAKKDVCMRKAFVARPGCVLVAADYCQIELRMMAHLSRDQNLIAEFHEDTSDVFRSMAGRVFSLPVSRVSEELRDRAKTLSYAIMYGAGTKRLVEQLGLERSGAVRLQQEWDNTYPGVKAYVKKVKQECWKDGHVTTIGGRRRHLAAIRSTDSGDRAKAERQAVSTKCQGSAADLIKMAMVRLDEELLPTDGPAMHAAASGRLLLQIHDELIFEVEEAHAPALCRQVRAAMQDAMELCVPLRVNIKQGRSWGELEKVEDD